MPEVTVAWSDLAMALQNKEACSRYDNGYRKEEQPVSEMDEACSRLKEQLGRGMYYGTINNVQML